jgi:hypothetical protein
MADEVEDDVVDALVETEDEDESSGGGKMLEGWGEDGETVNSSEVDTCGGNVVGGGCGIRVSVLSGSS